MFEVRIRAIDGKLIGRVRVNARSAMVAERLVKLDGLDGQPLPPDCRLSARWVNAAVCGISREARSAALADLRPRGNRGV